MKPDEDDEEETVKTRRQRATFNCCRICSSCRAVPASITGHGGRDGGPFLDLSDTDCSNTHSPQQPAIVNLLGHRRCCMWPCPWLPSSGTAASPQQSWCGEGLPGAELQPCRRLFWTDSGELAHSGAPVADPE